MKGKEGRIKMAQYYFRTRALLGLTVMFGRFLPVKGFVQHQTLLVDYPFARPVVSDFLFIVCQLKTFNDDSGTEAKQLNYYFSFIKTTPYSVTITLLKLLSYLF